MPTPQQPQPSTQPKLEDAAAMQGPEVVAEAALPGDSAEPAEHYKTIAVRVQENLHAQLSFIAQLSGTSLSEEIRRAIEGRIATAQDDPELITRAQAAREQIEREAAARKAAIAGFMGAKAVAPVADPAQRTRRPSKARSDQGAS